MYCIIVLLSKLYNKSYIIKVYNKFYTINVKFLNLYYKCYIIKSIL